MKSWVEPEGPVEARALVLVVDESPENRYVVRRTLTRAGMDVIEAGTGAEGRKLAAANLDLIILDVNLPDISGFELCRGFKADPATAHIPVIHLSQSAVDDESQVRGLEGGADAYITDPVRPRVLVATINALLRMRRAEDELRLQAADADRMAALNSSIAAARTEKEVIAALLDALSDPFGVRRAFLYPARPWVTAPTPVYPKDPAPGDDPPPASAERVDALLEAIAEHHGDGVAYEEADPCDWMVLPLIAYGREVATLLIEFAEGISLSARRQARLSSAGERCAAALERARLFEEQRAIASALQSSLLPATLPQLPGLELAADYRAGAEGMVVGGDFYDVFTSVTGWSAIVGDVCGRGAVAASQTSLARHTAREAARHDDNPGVVLKAVQRAIDANRRLEQLDLVSAVALTIFPRGGGTALTAAIAGHPLPILIRADGHAETVGSPGPILGLDPQATFVTFDLWLGSGDVLFLYTDGVIESRRAGELFGEARLMALLSELVGAGASVHDLADAPIRASAAYNELHADDMATLVLRAA